MCSTSSQVQITVLFFAKAREILGDRSEIQLQITQQQEPLNKSGLYSLLETSFPQLKVLNRSFAIAVNEEYLDESPEQDIVLENKDQVAVIPPISGG